MFLKGKYVFMLMLVSALAVAAEPESHLQNLTELLSTGEEISSFTQPIYAKSMVSDFYRLRQYQPAWTDRQFAGEVLKALGDSFNEGLDPDDYHYSKLTELFQSSERSTDNASAQEAEFELLMTDGVLLYALNIIDGKLDPAHLEESWNYKRRDPLPADVIAGLERVVASKTVVEKLNELKPKVELYKNMREGLAFYRQIQKDHPFVVIDETPVLKPGAQSAAVPKLRRRLIEMQMLDVSAASSDLYDDHLLKAVELFQARHGMSPDGVIGKQTWAAINMSWQARIDKLRVNMERTRWVYDNVTENFVVVNIAGFNLHVIRDSKSIWTTEVMTGAVDTETPLFMSRFSYLELNPTWTVPWSILQKSMIAKMKENPAYLTEHDFSLYDRQGKVVNLSTVDWASVSSKNFPYTVVQQPGERNALGQVKFIFPNAYSIYLHDTPAKSLFSKSARAFSHGCVRVKNPLELARILLDDPEKWNAAKISEVVASKERTRVSIEKPTAVMLMYWTSVPDKDANITFYPDIYSRDEAVLKALNASVGP